MRKFQIFRYLSKWANLIFIVSVLGSLFIYWYAARNQTYTASAVYEYISGGAADGVNPDGTPIDTSEITSAAVISDTINELGLNSNVEKIRSNCKITPIVDPDEEDKKKAAIERGEEYSYFPTAYRISYTVGSSSTKDYARDVLDSVLSNYFSLYNQKHVDVAVLPNNASNISADKYDYIECVQLLESSADEIIYFLKQRASAYSSFRSADTGMSFADLKESYENIRNNEIVGLHAYILNNKLVKNKELLLRNYENDRAKYQIQIENSRVRIDETKALLDKFGEKTLEEKDITYSFGSDIGSDQGLISNEIKDLDEEHRSKVETTYDRLINQYVSLQDQKITDEVKLNRCQEILDIYADANDFTDSESYEAVWATNEINKISAQLNELYDIIIPTIDEFNETNSEKNVTMQSSVIVREGINIRVYLALAIIFFFIMGCLLAIICGRAGDFMDYFMYTDAKTGLPNRIRCTAVIERYEKQPLPDDFVCAVFKVELSNPDIPGFGRKEGDVILSKFGSFLKNTMESITFVGYNDNGTFIAFAEKCSCKRVSAMIESLTELVENYNNNAPYPIKYSAGIAESGRDNIYSARELLREAKRNSLN